MYFISFKRRKKSIQDAKKNMITFQTENSCLKAGSQDNELVLSHRATAELM